jgi:hypothetical protein
MFPNAFSGEKARHNMKLIGLAPILSAFLLSGLGNLQWKVEI